MKDMRLLAVTLYALTWVARADDVVVLTDANFDEFVKNNDKVLVEFYAPWCGHCKKLEPEYTKAAAVLKADGSTTVLAKVDATAETAVAKRFEVKGFPTMKYFIGGEASEYGGGRSEATIISWIKKRELPAVSELADADAITALSKSDSIVLVGYFAKDSDADKAFRKFADAKRDNFVFGVVNDAAVAADNNNSVEMHREAGVDADKRKFDSVTVSLSGDINEDSIKKFLDEERFPFVDEIGPENYRDYMDRGLPLVWIAIDPSDADGKAALIEASKGFAKEHKGKLSFTYVDGVQYEGHVSNLGIKKSPGIVIVDNNSNKKYLFDGDVTSNDDLTKYYADYAAGKLTSFLKSEEVPEGNDGAVKVVVGKSFEDEVYSADKAVMVEFYAPWCGHCKKLTPEFQKLGEAFADRDDIVIAKMDSTANDNPSEDISGFPTLVFYPKGEDKEASKERYEGARTYEALKKFIEKKVPAPADKADDAGEPEDAADDEVEKEEL